MPQIDEIPNKVKPYRAIDHVDSLNVHILCIEGVQNNRVDERRVLVASGKFIIITIAIMEIEHTMRSTTTGEIVSNNLNARIAECVPSLVRRGCHFP